MRFLDRLAGILKGKYYPISVFISYSTEDAPFAGIFKTKLEKCWNFNVFTAHEDLEPSSEWEREIVRHLESCEVFLPLITNNFHALRWTDQESGIAFAKGKIVLPICFDELTPYGFLNRYQAFRHPADTSERGMGNSIRDVVSVLEKQGFSRRTLEGSIIGLENSYSFDMTRYVVKYL